MKRVIKIKTNDIFLAYAQFLLKEESYVEENVIRKAAVLFKHWKPNVEMTDEWKNNVCKDLGLETENKWALLNRLLRELNNTHIKLEVNKMVEACPIVIPIKYDKKRVLKLHPIIEAGLNSIIRNPKQLFELTITYVPENT